jgi:hypothetical protein
MRKSLQSICWISLLLCGCHSESRTPIRPPLGAPGACPFGHTPDGHPCVSADPTPAPSVEPQPVVPAAPPPVDAGAAILLPHDSAVPLDAVGAQAASAMVDAIAATRLGASVRRVGPVLAGNFTTGQGLERDFEAAPGKCYSVVGAGLPPVAEVQLKLVLVPARPGSPMAVLAEDKTAGPEAVLGAPPRCFKWAAPLAATLRLVLKVSQGQGVAGAHIYEE